MKNTKNFNPIERNLTKQRRKPEREDIKRLINIVKNFNYPDHPTLTFDQPEKTPETDNSEISINSKSPTSKLEDDPNPPIIIGSELF